MQKHESIALANNLYQEGDYEQSLSIYEQIANSDSLWEKVLSVNIRLCRSKLNQSIGGREKHWAIKKDEKESPLKPKFDGFGIVRHNPLISVVVVSYNSGDDLYTLLPTLKAQTYQNFELLVLENGKEDTEFICAKYFEHYQYFKEDNIGFAAGNNRCYDSSNGEFIALINPDTKLENNFLQELLDVIRYDEHAAIVAPKIYFYEKFVSLTIVGDENFSIDLAELLHTLPYKKYFVRSGIEDGSNVTSDENNAIKVDVPHPLEQLCIPVFVTTESGATRFKVSIGYKSEWVQSEKIDGLKSLINLQFDKGSYGSARYLINNAGSGVRDNGQPYDRGFGEYEDGQYLSKSYLGAFCGCAALIRKAAIIDRKIFIDEFFAYYEDSELSWWIQENNYRILYCPTAMIYHRHSESTEEKSAIWNCLVSRSHNLYSIITTKSYEKEHVRFYGDYAKLQNPALESRLRGLDESILKSDLYDDLTKRDVVTVCIYNSYFSSMGGGEKHALDIAALMQDKYRVYLVSEVDFDINNLQSYFDINIQKCQKIISTRIDTHFTSKFDVFINSTFQSNLEPAAKQSFYIVSFPHKHIDKNIVSKYHFLHNSPFTSRWAHEYWGDHQSSLVLPIIGYAGLDAPTELEKEKLILSVGRLTSEGHCKNHHLIIQAYKSAIDSKLIDSDWELVIAGSCDISCRAALEYYHLLFDLSDGYNIRLETNIDRRYLEDLYRNAFIYVHATGLGLPPDQPERHEHFGITPHEAMHFGCYPIVYCHGGPADQVKGLVNSATFFTLNELTEKISIISKKHKEWRNFYMKIQINSTNAAKNNFSNAFNILKNNLTDDLTGCHNHE
jgi:GT2 family glycosyltransferase